MSTPQNVFLSPLPSGTISLVDWSATQTILTNGSFTGGIYFYIIQACNCVGVRFRIPAGVTNPGTVRCKLWDPSGTQLATVDVAVTGAGTYSGIFTAVVISTLYSNYCVSIWDTAGKEIYIAQSPPMVAPCYISSGIGSVVLAASYVYGNGDSYPGTNIGVVAFTVPCEPIIY